MFSLGDLPGDLLTSIFEFVDEEDLPNIAVVNRSFNEAATPFLYRTISYDSKDRAKTPISTLNENRHLASHVQHFAIESLPSRHGRGHSLDAHHYDVRECVQILELCNGLRRFRVDSGCSTWQIRTFLPVLLRKALLQDVELLCASVITEQDDILTLTSLRNLRRIALKEPSWQLINKLPGWANSLRKSLRSVEITSSDCLNSEVLEDIIVHLPDLKELKIMSCFKINHDDILDMTKHTPLLENLNLTVWLNPGTNQSVNVGDIGHLRYLTLDMKNGSDKTHCTPYWKGFLTGIRKLGSRLRGLTLHPLRKVIIGVSFVKHIRRTHGSSLSLLELRNVVVSSKVLGAICSNLSQLEELALTINGSSIVRFAEAFALSSSLRIIRNIPDRTSQSQTTLNNHHVREIAKLAFSVTIIECQGRKWNIMRNVNKPKDFAILYAAKGTKGTRQI
ncbi:hypothetical protein SCHPADRAFT_998875 [Schizopora paradoxa]|uniref:F-box domain-containing protein n=1 Tax=Schizopora paradoxa TaxID=27342 RepID=A0A0H2RI22_9AGAM|nr:hypothetical protein SCHPADRAFT_998875 [Schizopora paradoxa]